MFEFKNGHDFSTDQLPLREFAAHHGQTSRMPSPPAQDSYLPSRFDTKENIKPPDEDAQEASDSLLTHTSMCSFSVLSIDESVMCCIEVAHVFRETSTDSTNQASY